METPIRIEVPMTADKSGCARLHEILDSLEVHDKQSKKLIVKSVYSETPGDDAVVGTLHLNWIEEEQRGEMWTVFYEDGRAQLYTRSQGKLLTPFKGWKDGLSRTCAFILQTLANHGANGDDDRIRFQNTSFV